MTTGTVHFSIDLEWLTDTIRNMWAEGRYGAATRAIESSGCPKQLQDDVIRGTRKMVGNESDGRVVADDWTPPEDEFYPDPNEIPDIAEQSRRWRDLALRTLGAAYYRTLNEYRRNLYAGSKRDEQESILRSYPKEFTDTLPEKDRPPHVTTAPLILDSDSYDVDAYIARQIELSHKGAPSACDPADSKHGWIQPNGAFYPCGWMEHDWLAGALGKTVVEAEAAGWVRVGFNTSGTVPSIKHNENYELNQRQIDTLYDWCAAHDVDVETAIL